MNMIGFPRRAPPVPFIILPLCTGIEFTGVSVTFAPAVKFVPARLVIETLVVLIPVAGVIPDIVGTDAAPAVPVSSSRAAMNRQTAIAWGFFMQSLLPFHYVG